MRDTFRQWQTIKMLLLFTLVSSFQALIATACEIPSSRNETLIDSAKKVAVRVVGGEITNIRNYPFLVGEMRPWSFLNIKSKQKEKEKEKKKKKKKTLASRALIVSEKTLGGEESETEGR